MQKSLAMPHIQDCQCKLKGYYSVDDRFYEEIVFNYPLDVQLEHFSIGEASDDGSRWMKLKYILYSQTSRSENLKPDGIYSMPALVWWKLFTKTTVF